MGRGLAATLAQGMEVLTGGVVARKRFEKRLPTEALLAVIKKEMNLFCYTLSETLKVDLLFSTIDDANSDGRGLIGKNFRRGGLGNNGADREGPPRAFPLKRERKENHRGED